MLHEALHCALVTWFHSQATRDFFWFFNPEFEIDPFLRELSGEVS